MSWEGCFLETLHLGVNVCVFVFMSNRFFLVSELLKIWKNKGVKH